MAGVDPRVMKKDRWATWLPTRRILATPNRWVKKKLSRRARCTRTLLDLKTPSEDDSQGRSITGSGGFHETTTSAHTIHHNPCER
jgi:hypothetical protein